MRIHTSSEGVTLAKNLEIESAQFYEETAKQHPEVADAFRAFASENRKNARHIERTYYSVITDAIESGYCLNLESDDFTFDATIQAFGTHEPAVTQATQIEQCILSFYTTAEAQMGALMADLTRAFGQQAKKRRKRLLTLSELLQPDASSAK